jgi:hypothetical protein
MNAQNLATNAQNTRPRTVGSDLQEEKGKNVPTLDEIHRRAVEIHIERGGHGCDLDNYLDEWLQAERELKEKCSTSNDEGAKNEINFKTIVVAILFRDLRRHLAGKG